MDESGLLVQLSAHPSHVRVEQKMLENLVTAANSLVLLEPVEPPRRRAPSEASLAPEEEVQPESNEPEETRVSEEEKTEGTPIEDNTKMEETPSFETNEIPANSDIASGQKEQDQKEEQEQDVLAPEVDNMDASGDKEQQLTEQPHHDAKESAAKEEELEASSKSAAEMTSTTFQSVPSTEVSAPSPVAADRSTPLSRPKSVDGSRPATTASTATIAASATASFVVDEDGAQQVYSGAPGYKLHRNLNVYLIIIIIKEDIYAYFLECGFLKRKIALAHFFFSLSLSAEVGGIGSGMSSNTLSLAHSYGYDARRANNLALLDADNIVFIAGERRERM